MLLTVSQLAKELNIQPGTLYAWAAQGKIPCVKLNKLVRFRRDAIDQWLESCQCRPTHESKQPTKTRGPGSDVATLIARAKAQVYTPRPRGNQTEFKPHRKGGAGWG